MHINEHAGASSVPTWQHYRTMSVRSVLQLPGPRTHTWSRRRRKCMTMHGHLKHIGKAVAVFVIVVDVVSCAFLRRQSAHYRVRDRDFGNADLFRSGSLFLRRGDNFEESSPCWIPCFCSRARFNNCTLVTVNPQLSQYGFSLAIFFLHGWNNKRIISTKRDHRAFACSLADMNGCLAVNATSW